MNLQVHPGVTAPGLRTIWCMPTGWADGGMPERDELAHAYGHPERNGRGRDGGRERKGGREKGREECHLSLGYGYPGIPWKMLGVVQVATCRFAKPASHRKRRCDAKRTPVHTCPRPQVQHCLWSPRWPQPNRTRRHPVSSQKRFVVLPPNA